MINEVFNEDCLEGMKRIPSGSVDMILCDLPYGTTTCKWDVVIPFEPLWEQYERVIKENGAIVLTGSQPFTTDLINSNRKLFRYEIIWEKSIGANPLLCKRMPMKYHENICVFYQRQPTYNPQKTKGKMRNKKVEMYGDKPDENWGGSIRSFKGDDNYNDDYYPRSVQYISNADQKGKQHPTQKPVALFEYLIKTYTNEGEVVLDNCMGSGTTSIACINTNRNYIGFEKEEKYYNIIQNRIAERLRQTELFKVA